MRYIKVEVQPDSMNLWREAVRKLPNLVGLWNTTHGPTHVLREWNPFRTPTISNRNLILEALNQTIGSLNGCSNIKMTLTPFFWWTKAPQKLILWILSARMWGVPVPGMEERQQVTWHSWGTCFVEASEQHHVVGSSYVPRWPTVSAVPTDRRIRWKRRHPWKAPSEVASWASKMGKGMWRPRHFSRECPPKSPLCQEYESWWNSNSRIHSIWFTRIYLIVVTVTYRTIWLKESRYIVNHMSPDWHDISWYIIISFTNHDASFQNHVLFCIMTYDMFMYEYIYIYTYIYIHTVRTPSELLLMLVVLWLGSPWISGGSSTLRLLEADFLFFCSKNNTKSGICSHGWMNLLVVFFFMLGDLHIHGSYVSIYIYDTCMWIHRYIIFRHPFVYGALMPPKTSSNININQWIWMLLYFWAFYFPPTKADTEWAECCGCGRGRGRGCCFWLLLLLLLTPRPHGVALWCCGAVVPDGQEHEVFEMLDAPKNEKKAHGIFKQTRNYKCLRWRLYYCTNKHMNKYICIYNCTYVYYIHIHYDNHSATWNLRADCFLMSFTAIISEVQ